MSKRKSYRIMPLHSRNASNNSWMEKKKHILLLSIDAKTYDMTICRAWVVFLEHKYHHWYRWLTFRARTHGNNKRRNFENKNRWKIPSLLWQRKLNRRNWFNRFNGFTLNWGGATTRMSINIFWILGENEIKGKCSSNWQNWSVFLKQFSIIFFFLVYRLFVSLFWQRHNAFNWLCKLIFIHFT